MGSMQRLLHDSLRQLDALPRLLCTTEGLPDACGRLPCIGGTSSNVAHRA